MRNIMIRRRLMFKVLCSFSLCFVLPTVSWLMCRTDPHSKAWNVRKVIESKYGPPLGSIGWKRHLI